MTTTLTAGKKAAQDVSALLRARNPLLWIVTREEARAERLLAEAIVSAQYEPRFWDCAGGVTNLAGEEVDQGRAAVDPQVALSAIRDTRQRQVWILRDFPAFLKDPFVCRGLRNLARSLPSFARDEARAVIVLSPSGEVPDELAGHAIVLEWPLPDRTEVAELLDAAIAVLPEDMRGDAAKNGTREAAIDAAVGLTAVEAQSCYAKSLVQTRKIDPATVAAEKRRVISRERVLEWFDPLPGGLDAVGGLDVLKPWLVQRRAAFTAKAREYGLPAPKGVMLVGVPGCGKSLTAKAIATAWGVPLLKLDLGALRSKWVGESEGNIRRALRVAEAVAPCVVWMDEIEKALAGATEGAADGGVSGDALGVILTWMQEKQGSVFVIATSNDVSKLPPELLRKGRFDELFFVDLPTSQERKDIVAASVRSLRARTETLDLTALANATLGFTGAEIAALLPEAMYRAFADGERKITTEDLLAVAKTTVPLSKTASQKIEALRKWAEGRARPATTPEKTTTTGRGALDL
jgi:hypothetical protein